MGGLPFDLTEGDVIAVMSQYGEIVDVNLVRDRDTGKSKGFSFVAYEDQRSTVLAVDNLNGFEVRGATPRSLADRRRRADGAAPCQLLGRTLRVDHVAGYKKEKLREDEKEREEQLERMKKSEVVRAWTQDNFNAKRGAEPWLLVPCLGALTVRRLQTRRSER